MTLVLDQKHVLAGEFIRLIRTGASGSLLDIGAGAGYLPETLAAHVSRYVAIECDPDRADRLVCAGIDVIRAAFPLPIADRFDIVLSSHSIPEADWEAYPPFLDAMWDRLAPTGLFVLVTFKGIAHSPLNDWLTASTGRRFSADPRYARIKAHIEYWGATLHEDAIHSGARSHDPGELLDFVAPGVRARPDCPEHDVGKTLRSFVRTFRQGDEYSVKIPHNLLWCRKPGG